MSGVYSCCPVCGHHDLDPRKILIGFPHSPLREITYQEIITLRCQACGWIGEQAAQ